MRARALLASVLVLALGVGGALELRPSPAEAEVVGYYVRRAGDTMNGPLIAPSFRVPVSTGKFCLTIDCIDYIISEGGTLSFYHSTTRYLFINPGSTATMVNNAVAPAFIPNSSTIPTNGVYLPAANQVGIAGNSTLLAAFDQASGQLQNKTGPVLSAVGTAGFASINATLIGKVDMNVTAVGNAADTSEDTLISFGMAGNSMSASAKGVRVTAWGSGVSTADVTTVRCYFGATAVLTRILTASQANTWRAQFEVWRTGATTQIATGTFVNGGAVVTTVQSNSSPGETLSGVVTIKCTGQRATTSTANSVQQLGMLTEFIN